MAPRSSRASSTPIWLWFFLKVAQDLTQAEEVFPSRPDSGEWGVEASYYYSMPSLSRTNFTLIEGNTEEDEEVWLLDEEHITSPTSVSPSSNHAEREVWWKVLGPGDPALGAEPARWDGAHLNHTQSPHLFQDYEVLQDNWLEDSVT